MLKIINKIKYKIPVFHSKLKSRETFFLFPTKTNENLCHSQNCSFGSYSSVLNYFKLALYFKSFYQFINVAYYLKIHYNLNGAVNKSISTTIKHITIEVIIRIVSDTILIQKQKKISYWVLNIYLHLNIFETHF